MTSREFENALKEPDNDASNLRLYELIAAGVFSDDGLPHAAENYLRAFCSAALSHARRRWVGIALAAMLDASVEVAKHMASAERELQGMGNVILSNTEREETKIVAGIIMRQALEQHVDFKRFWASDKVRNGATTFPVDTGFEWMQSFQSFLDTLGDLLLAANPITDPLIIYPVSVVGSDGFQWGSMERGKPIVLAQYELLTVLMPDELLKEIQFLDVPIANIQATKTRPSAPLHDSQSHAKDHEPWDLILTLKTDTNTYQLNSSKRTATELSIMCQGMRDAKEIEAAIGDLRQRQSIEAPLSDSKSRKQHLVCRSSPIAINRHRSSKSPQTSSDQLGKTATESPQWPTPNIGRETRQGTRQKSPRMSKTSREAVAHKSSTLAQDQADARAMQPVDDSEAMQRDGDTKLERATKKTDTAQSRKSDRQPQQDARGSTTRIIRKRAQIESMQSSSSVGHAPATLSSVSNSIASTRPIVKKDTYSWGKLPKVSQTTKQKASQQLRKQPDVFDIPVQGGRKSATKKHAHPEGVFDTEPNTHAGLKSASAATKVRPTIHQGKKARSKRNAEEDDDFIPEAAKPTKTAGTKRKSAADANVTTEGSRKKSKPEHESSPKDASRNAKIQQNNKTLQQRKSKESGKTDSSNAASRTSLIGGLLGLQNPSATITPFKVPAVPSRSPHSPSTPLQRRHMQAQPDNRPHTPTGLRKPPKTPATLIASSPPLNNLGTEDYVRRQNGAADTEILSSNSKPTPASPNAESTAISGHADRDDVDFEKITGEIQIARLDPFKQRREGSKSTSFIRRLTGDSLPDEGTIANSVLLHSDPLDVGGNTFSDTDGFSVKAASQSLPQPILSGDEKGSPHYNASISQLFAGKTRAECVQIETTGSQAGTKTHQGEVGAKTTSADVAEKHSQRNSDNVVQPLRTLKRKAVNLDESHDAPTKRTSLSVAPQSNLEQSSAAPEKSASVHENEAVAAQDDSIVTAPQQAIDETQTPRPTEAHDDFAGDNTLVNDGSEEHSPDYKASPVNFRSSPPMPGTPSSSHSSTSAEPEPSPRSPLPTSQAEEKEWEATLQPHQRALHDLLMRVSKRVLRHVVDNETAVTDIADVYANDAEHLVNDILQRQDGECKDMWEDMDGKKATLKKETMSSLKALVKERQRIGTLS